MDIGPTNALSAAELSQQMAERICSAHQAAVEQQDAGEVEGSDQIDAAQRGAADEVGADLRAKLETLVDQVVTDGPGDSDRLLRDAIEAIVDDRVQRSEIPGGGEYRDEIAERLENDPVVVAELGEIMQEIARDLALRGS